MIQPDAKCVVNGAKVNEAITALNPLLAMSVGYIGGGKPPQVTYSDGEVKILLPLADSVAGFSLEELDIVDTDNAASSRYFMTSSSSVSTYGTTTASTSGTPTGKQSTSQPTSKDRNSLGNTPNDKNRDKLTTGAGRPIAPGNAGVAPTVNISTGRPIADGSTAADSRAKFLDERERAAGGSANMISVGGAGVDEFGNAIGGAGRPVADGSTAADSRAKFLAARQGATTPAPLPGAPPLGGDTTPAPLPGAPPPNQPATTPTEASPTAEAASDAATSTAGDTTASKDGEFVDWREAEKARIKSRMKTLSSRVSADSSPEQIADVRESLSRLIKEYERVSKM